MEASFELEGAERLQAALQRLGPRALELGGRAIRTEAELIMTKAKRRTPVDTGNLRASGHVQGPTFSREGATVVLGFGGVAGSGNHGNATNDEEVGYAVYVHEDLTKNHPVGQAKFLESAIREAISGMSSRLAQRIRREGLTSKT